MRLAHPETGPKCPGELTKQRQLADLLEWGRERRGGKGGDRRALSSTDKDAALDRDDGTHAPAQRQRQAERPGAQGSC